MEAERREEESLPLCEWCEERFNGLCMMCVHAFRPPAPVPGWQPLPSRLPWGPVPAHSRPHSTSPDAGKGGRNRHPYKATPLWAGKGRLAPFTGRTREHRRLVTCPGPVAGGRRGPGKEGFSLCGIKPVPRGLLYISSPQPRIED